jgi:hypothetical protein
MLEMASNRLGDFRFFTQFLLDLGCLWLYKQRHKMAWSRMKNIRKIRLQTTHSVN